MDVHLSRRGFLISTAAVAGAAALPRWARGLAQPEPARPETYFEVTLAGRPLEGPEAQRAWGGQAVCILLGSAAGASNSLVYRTRGGSVLVDTATSPLGLRMVEDARVLAVPMGDGVTQEHDALVINTHHHADHTGGNWALGAAGIRPRVLMHARADERVRGMLDRYRGAASGGVQAAGQVEGGARRAMAVASAEAFAAGVAELTEEDFGASETFDAAIHEIVLGDRPVVLHHFGAGHTDNDVVVHLPDENVVHCGDLLFAGMHPFFADDSGARCRGWIESVGKIIDLCDQDTVVVPGHGPVGNVRELHRQREYLEQLWEAVEREVASGTPREAVMRMAWPFMEGLEREQIRARAIGAVFDEVAGEG
jgi:glyoxylase-like metal-dependent hydrolase (beta-lactamase superfamily II)